SGGAVVTTGVVGTSPVNGGGTALSATAFVAGGTYTSLANVNDNFTGVYAALNGTTINGNAGDTDTITFTDAVSFTAGAAGLNNGTNGGTISNIKTLTLGNFANTVGFVNTAAGATTGITTINGGTGNDSVDFTNSGNSLLAGNVNLGLGNNTLTLETAKTYTGTFSAGAGVADILVATGANIAGANVAGFETLFLGGGATTTLTAAQYNAFTTFNAAAGADVVTLTTAGTITGTTLAGTAGIESYNLANGTNSVTLALSGVNQTFTGGTGNDTFTTTAANLAWKTLNAAGGTGDTLTVTDAIAAAFTLKASSAAGAVVTGVEIVNFNASTGANVVTMFDGVATVNAAGGNFVLGTGGQTLISSGAVTVTGGAGVDSITLSSGADTIDATNTIAGTRSTIGAIDTVTNFKVAGVDVFKTGTAATTLNLLSIATADTSTLAAAIATAATAAGASLAATTQAYVITVAAGTAAGTYAFQNVGGTVGTVDATDFIVKLVGAGSIVAGDFIA
ncbi:beta strand repeat-containing protein, partial [Undibacterium sp. Ji49W]|uniref:beta strand repeat-containing protein n=1 Tax=Undibacterium sp. Ji49W TaxID=3413040 RepID=UPI003BEF9B76